MKILIVVPAFNEETNLSAVISNLKKAKYHNIVIVDDGSEDRTSEIAKKKNVILLRHLINRGLGAALGTGFEFAKKNHFDILVTFDADGQHISSDIKNLLRPLVAGKADVVVGSRLLKQTGRMPLDRWLLNHLSNLATYFLYGVWASDTLSGLRGFNREAIEKIKIKTDRMEVSNEFYKEIKRNKLRYSEISIKPIYTEYSLRNSHQGNFISSVPKLAFRMVIRVFR